MTHPIPDAAFTAGIPSLREWLGDGDRGEAFESWVRESLAIEQAAANDRDAAAVRIIRTLAIAIVEVCRMELARGGLAYADIVQMLARCAGVVVMTTVLCGVRDDASLHELAAIIVEEFQKGAALIVSAAQKDRSHG